jgi:hypothetical protein
LILLFFQFHFRHICASQATPRHAVHPQSLHQHFAKQPTPGLSLTHGVARFISHYVTVPCYLPYAKFEPAFRTSVLLPCFPPVDAEASKANDPRARVAGCLHHQPTARPCFSVVFLTRGKKTKCARHAILAVDALLPAGRNTLGGYYFSCVDMLITKCRLLSLLLATKWCTALRMQRGAQRAHS